MKILSENLKTTKSINFSLDTCSPTKICKKLCYGNRYFFTRKVTKDRMNETSIYFHSLPAEVIGEKIVNEYYSNNLNFLRWCGVGDLWKESVDVLNWITVNHPELVNWVVTRKPEVVRHIKPGDNLYLMFSLDAASENKLKKLELHPRLYFSYLRTSPEDKTDGVSVIFNAHQFKSILPYDDIRRCCPVDAGKMKLKDACIGCRRCFTNNVFKLANPVEAFKNL